MNDLLLFGGLAVAVWAVFEARRRFVVRRAESWPEVLGTIESVEVSGIRSWPEWKSSFTARVNYSYRVEDSWFAGQVKRRFNDEQKAWDFVGQLRGKAVLVRYKPNKPEKSVIWRTLDGV